MRALCAGKQTLTTELEVGASQVKRQNGVELVTNLEVRLRWVEGNSCRILFEQLARRNRAFQHTLRGFRDDGPRVR